MRADWVALSEVVRLPRNAKLHDVADIADSLGEFGFVDRVIINEATGHLVGGHGRLDALERMRREGKEPPAGIETRGGEWLIPCDYIQCEPEREDALALRLNVSQMRGGDYTIEEILRGFDREMLADVLADASLAAAAGLEDAARALAGKGNEERDAEPKFEIAEELRERWGTARGQVWRLGKHRVMCGDCTDAGDVERLMGEARAALTFTSPPYWVGKEYEREKTLAEVDAFIQRVAAGMVFATRRDYSRIVINSGTGMQNALRSEKGKRNTLLLIDKWTNTLNVLGWNLRHVRHWLKHGGLMATAAKSDMIDQHCEFFCTYDTPDGLDYDAFDDDEIRLAMTYYYADGKNRGREKLGDKSWALKAYWDDIHGNANSDGHVAAMPLLVAVRHVLMYSKRDEIVFEPFLGSGTTLMACENLGRVCYAMEIEPKYVAVSIQRWVDATGGTPELVEG